MSKRIVYWAAGGSLGCLGSSVLTIVGAVALLVAILGAVLNSANPGTQIQNAASAISNQISQAAHANGLSDARSWQGATNKTVVSTALDLAHYVHIGPPSYQAQWYDEDQPIMQQAMMYWESVCPGCWYWQNGKLQCVMFVIAAYALANQPVPLARDAELWWSDYQDQAGWLEIANPFDASNPPLPGDIAVWSGGEAGHVAIVTDVKLPSQSNQTGSIQVAQANTPEGSRDTYPLVRVGSQLLMPSKWPGYTVLGFIRHSGYVQ